jgi:hypothetical protein
MADETGYNELNVLTGYIWKNFRDLMTADEELAARAFTVEGKLEPFRSAARVPTSLARERKKYQGSSFVDQALKAGMNQFQRDFRDRILKETPEGFMINRCPSCQRVVVSPYSKQCLWCGHDWHQK